MFEAEMAMIMEALRGIHTTAPWTEQPYWKDIQRLKQLAYFEVAATISQGKTP